MDDYLGERLQRERAGIGLALARVPLRHGWRRRVRRVRLALARLTRRPARARA